MELPTRLFVYGTLRKGHVHPMPVWLEQQAQWLGQAWFQGQLFKVADYPGAIDSANPADRVLGDVYELHDFEPCIARLDDYEECGPSQALPHLYRREIRDVQRVGAAERMSAWIYIYNRSVDTLERIGSGDFFSGA